MEIPLVKANQCTGGHRPGKAALTRFYSLFNSKDHVCVLIDPDPDAIGSALAVKRLLWHKVCSTSIVMVRTIKRLNNLTMVRMLHLPLLLAKKTALDKFTKFVLVDAQPDHNTIFQQVPLCAVIDHHPVNNDIAANFIDIRPETGATSTIMTEYLRAAKIKPSVVLATTLLYGIKTDTRSFERHTQVQDITAFQYLYPLADKHVLRKIEIADLSLKDLKFFHKAIERKHVVRDRIFVYLDEVPSADLLVEIAEFLLKIHDISWSIVSGIYEDNLIISIRNDGYRKDAGKLARRAFGDIGSAGGHQSMARAEIPMNKLANILAKKTSTEIERFIRGSLSPFSKR